MAGLLPWAGMMRAAARLGVAPEAFWRLSLREWRWLADVGGVAGAMGRAELEALMAAHPDRPAMEETGDGGDGI